MTTCCIEPYFRKHFSGHTASVASGLFDLTPAVTRFNPSELAGIQLNEEWVLGPRLNIISGLSGSGKTRVLDAMKGQCRLPPNLHPPATVDFTGKSMGQAVLILTDIMLHIQPTGTCLFLDDVFGFLDQESTAHVCRLLQSHVKQIVLTVNSHAESLVMTLCESPMALCFHLPLIPPEQTGTRHA